MSADRSHDRHVALRVVLDYLDQKLGAAARADVDEHLGRPCAVCRERVRAVGELLETMRLDRTSEVPDWLHARAVAVFAGQEHPTGVRGLLAALAELVFDSHTAPLAAAARRSVGEARRLRFALADHLLDCELERESATTQMLRGRLVTEDPALWTLAVSVGGERRQADPDANGAFALASLPHGALDITVEGPAGRFRLPAIEP